MTKKIKHYYEEIFGWFDFDNVYKHIVETFEEGHFVEIGCFLGKSSAFMVVEIINSGKKIKFDMVDTFEKWEGVNNSYNQFKENNPIIFQKKYKDQFRVLKASSVFVSKMYNDNSLDFVFIDACHDYDSVLNDIMAWYPKVKQGGILSGHDFADAYQGVKKAVKDFSEKNNQDFIINKQTWLMKKGHSMFKNNSLMLLNI